MNDRQLLPRCGTLNATVWSLPCGPGHCPGYNPERMATCAVCYGAQGRFRIRRVERLRQARLKFWQGLTPGRLSRMIRILRRRKWVRVFGTGDFRCLNDIHRWTEIARSCPQTRFWFSTRIPPGHGVTWWAALHKLHALPNVCVRSSALYRSYLRNPEEFISSGLPMSVVTEHPGHRGCPKQQYGSCGAAGCRACWDKTAPVVVYKRHGHRVQWPKRRAA